MIRNIQRCSHVSVCTRVRGGGFSAHVCVRIVDDKIHGPDGVGRRTRTDCGCRKDIDPFVKTKNYVSLKFIFRTVSYFLSLHRGLGGKEPLELDSGRSGRT